MTLNIMYVVDSEMLAARTRRALAKTKATAEFVTSPGSHVGSWRADRVVIRWALQDKIMRDPRFKSWWEESILTRLSPDGIVIEI